MALPPGDGAADRGRTVMSEKEYSVSEAVRLVGVESHVLRYWEDELGLGIRRNAQGHRIYSEENISALCRAKELKERGLQLKAIRLLLDEQKGGSSEDGAAATLSREQELERQIREFAEEAPVREAPAGEVPVREKTVGGVSVREMSVGEAPVHEAPVGGASVRETPVAEVPVHEAPVGGASVRETPVAEVPVREASAGEAPAHETPGARSGTEESPELCYEVVLTGKQDKVYQFEQIMRRLIEEVVSEQNDRLEKAIADRLKEELEDYCLQYHQMMQEAAAALETNGKRPGRLRRMLEKLFPAGWEKKDSGR